MKKRFVTRLVVFVLLLVLSASGLSIIISTKNNQSAVSFEDKGRALTKALKIFNHSQYIMHTGLSSEKRKDLFTVSLSTDTEIPSILIDSMVKTYLHKASSFDHDGVSNQFLKSDNLKVNVHMWKLNGPILYTGTKTHDSNVITWKFENPQPQWIPVHDVILAESNISARSGNKLELVDVNGHYAEDPEIGPFFGPNWTGHFQLRVVNSKDAIVFTFNLPDNKFYQYLFMGKFQFHFSDYNGDGNPDFTLGQYAGSNGFDYELFEITDNGIKALNTIPNPIFAAEGSYSTVFPKVATNAFLVEDYNNATQNYEIFTFVWKNGEFKITNLRTLPTYVKIM